MEGERRERHKRLTKKFDNRVVLRSRVTRRVCCLDGNFFDSTMTLRFIKERSIRGLRFGTMVPGSSFYLVGE